MYSSKETAIVSSSFDEEAMAPNPISPDDIPPEPKNLDIPYFVFDVFNELIIEKFNYHTKSAKVHKESAAKRITENSEAKQTMELYCRTLGVYEIYNSGWLDIEPWYREQGWQVERTCDITGGRRELFIFTAKPSP